MILDFDIDGLVQDCSNSIVNSLELLHSCNKPSILWSLSIESVKTTSIENVSTGVLDKNKEHYLRCKDKGKKSYDVLKHTQLHMSKYQ